MKAVKAVLKTLVATSLFASGAVATAYVYSGPKPDSGRFSFRVQGEWRGRLQAAAYDLMEKLTGSPMIFQLAPKEAYIKRATDSTGLADFGDPIFLEAYDTYYKCMQEAALNIRGKMSYGMFIQQALKTRLLLIQYLKEHPEVKDRKLPPTFVISGQARGGSTLLHRLLALDPSARSIYPWEAMGYGVFPLQYVGKYDAGYKQRAEAKDNEPAPSDPDALQDPRAVMYRKGLAKMKEFYGDKFSDLHPLSAELPEEELLMMMNNFFEFGLVTLPSSHRWFALLNKPRFVESVYDDLLTQLQMVMVRNKDYHKHLVLKCPAHSAHIDHLFRIIPEAKVVLTHREPVTSLVSNFSLLERYMEVAFVDRFHLASELLKFEHKKKIVNEIRHAMSEEQERAHFFDCHYEEFVKDPIAMVKKIYAHWGMSVSDEYEARMKKFLKENPTHARHKYSIERYGVTKEEILELGKVMHPQPRPKSSAPAAPSTSTA